MTRAANFMDLPREIRSHVYSLMHHETARLLRENLELRDVVVRRGGMERTVKWNVGEAAVVRRGDMVFRVYRRGTVLRRRQGSATWVALLGPYGSMMDAMMRVVTKERETYEVVGLRDNVVTARPLVLGGAKDKSEAAKKLAYAVIDVIG